MQISRTCFFWSMFFPSWAIISCNTYTNKREFLSGCNKEPPSRQRGNHTGNLQNSCRFQAGIPNPKPTSINRMQPPQKIRKHPEPGRDVLKKTVRTGKPAAPQTEKGFGWLFLFNTNTKASFLNPGCLPERHCSPG